MAEAGSTTPNYEDWSKDQLVQRLKDLEEQLKRQQQSHETQPAAKQSQHPQYQQQQAAAPPKKKQKKNRKLDPSKYSTRVIALKLAYLGKNYGGFEYQGSANVPTIEEELWKALCRACLIWPENPDKVDFTPWEYSKCGRTDKGVSAFGQVITIKVRSNRPVSKKEEEVKEDVEMTDVPAEGEQTKGKKKGDDKKQKVIKSEWDPIADEINYPRVLNRLLPPDIRILAWAPTLPPNFSARYSCYERQYRYFFTNPAFSPLPPSLDPGLASSDGNDPNKPREGWLDIDAMRMAAKLFEGVHDFRNFCKVDGAKQISNFTRRVFEADIVEVDDATSSLPFLTQRPDLLPSGFDRSDRYPKVYYFHVRGSAFLWHQIRHMVSVLFAIGQGLEKPSLVTELLDADSHPRRPNYAMADEVPLVLWDCIFPKLDEDMSRKMANVHDPSAQGYDKPVQDGIDWVWVGEDGPGSLHGAGGLVDQLWETWRERKMDELLAGRLLDAVAKRPNLERKLIGGELGPRPGQRVFEGGNTGRPSGSYVPVLKRPLLASPEEINDKWAQSKGFKNSAELAQTKNWRAAIKARKTGDNSAMDSGEE
ncbi:pseudouridylate synthase-like protein [Thermochaetoides thermophila DSM 1495]|uniref:Pseudouridylate synthase-like protein n=1 Tax=Chaetomium thermophilum (strain DSM 1495 / CBS 144.50 / IMI 039719) TaxID=759272 RepID=G0RXY9_CHATD|nr:pseudouridylate synthase-like protein [Thermochaetoides thermophila DSM 1495]EGS23775.1 pseudouridylate synthase-like protein [Thermochaetoides thermophila DSM 1495]